MKNLLLSVLLLLASGQVSAQTPEETAVKAVIERELETFGAANLEKWSATYTQTENTLRLAHDLNNTTVMQGWQKQLAFAAEMFKGFPGGLKFEVERTNWNIRVSGNVAWATFDQVLSVPQFGMKDVRATQIRCLEKTGGKWTISVLSYTVTSPADTPAEQEAIKKVCMAESQAYIDFDFDAWASHHTQRPDEQLAWNNPDGTYGAQSGWETIGPGMKAWFAEAKKVVDIRTNENFTILIQGDMAMAAYDSSSKNAEGKITRMREHRTLLRLGGQWKVLAVQVYADHLSGK